MTTSESPPFTLTQRHHGLDGPWPRTEIAIHFHDESHALTVDLYHPHVKYGQLAPSEISWPSTTDKRPRLALALSYALQLAVEEAKRLDREAGLEVAE